MDDHGNGDGGRDSGVGEINPVMILMILMMMMMISFLGRHESRGRASRIKFKK